MNSLELSPDLLAFVALLPHVEPVLALVVLTSIDNAQHVFSRVLLIRALTRTIGLKVLEHCARIVSDRTKVHSLTTSGEEQQLVKLLEEHGAGLMNCAKNCLAVLGKLAKE
jgi:hypothetical protein